MTWDQIVHRLATASSPWEIAANVLLQTTLILAAGLVAGRLSRSGGAALQSLVYRTTLVAVLLCPLLAFGLNATGFDRLVLDIEPYFQPEGPDPQIAVKSTATRETVESSSFDLPLPPQVDANTEPAAAEPEQTASLSMPQSSHVELTSPPPYEQSPAAPAPVMEEAPQQVELASNNTAVAVALLAAATWIFLSVYLLVRLAIAQLRTVRLRRMAIPVDPAEAALCRQLAADFQVRPPEVLRAPFLSGACLIGYWRPAVLLPDADDTPLRQALMHELAHLSRHDCLWNLLRQLATALFPVQPLVWLLARRIAQTAEEVCDDFVVQHGADRCNYAELLVDLASRNMAPPLPAGVGMISFRSLSARRIARILDASRSLSTRVGGGTITATLLIAVAATLLTASLGVGAGEAEAIEEQDAQGQQQNEEPGAGSDASTDAGTKNALTIRGKGVEREMLVRGRVVDADGRAARECELGVNVNEGYISRALSPKLDGHRFEVWVPIGRSVGSSLELFASSKDGQQRGLRRIPTWGLRQAAIEGIDLVLARASRTVLVYVTKDGTPVAKAQVTAALEGNTLRSETNAEGKARFHLMANERFSQLTAWTQDFQVGGYDFYRKPYRDPLANLFRIELEDCRDQAIRFVDANDGSPIPGVKFALTIGTGPPNYNFPGNWQTLPQSKMTTNDKGEVTYRWFPDWTQHAVEIHLLDRRWAKAESDDVTKADDRALVVKLKPRVERKPLIGKVASESVDVGGLLVLLQTFQGEEENHSDRAYAITEHDGSFTADCLPGATYWVCIADERYVSKIIDLIPYEPETGKSNVAMLQVSEGEPVEIRVTFGPSRQPMRNQWVHLRAPHEYTWQENGETRRGNSGRQWGVSTDANGIARAWALAGSELKASVNAGEWRSPDQNVTVQAGEVTKIEFHRQITIAREVTGQLIPPPGLEVDLARAEIVLGSVDGQADERQTTESDARGRFTFKTKALQVGIFAYTADGKAFGIATPQDATAPIEVQLEPTVDLHGQLLGKDDKPLVGHAVRVEPHVSAKERRKDVSFGTSFVAKTFETKTDSQGNYTLKGLPTELAMTVRADSIDGSEYDTHLEEVFLNVGEERRRMVSRLGDTRADVDQSLAEQYESLLRDATLGGFRMMVLVFESTASDFVNANLLDYDRTKEVGFFMHLEIGEDDLADAAAAQFVKTKQWPSPRPRTVFACALDAAGRELGRIELDITEGDATRKAENFIKKYAPTPADAQEKWDAAFAEAKRSQRKVWARVSQRYCGPCLVMSRWLDDNRKLLERDYVLLKIDNVRDEHGQELAQRIVSNRSDFSIPFSAVFDTDENVLIDSEGPIGNIGHPSGYEGRRHLKKMFSDTRSNLSLEQIEQIVNTLDE
ncbi:MAG: M56 family metallopeptidase [Pirellulales bacterium]